MVEVVKSGWALLWRSSNSIDGNTRHLMWHGGKPLFFKTRREARNYRTERYGYILSRPDLKAEPDGWKFPAVVRATLTLSMKEENGTPS